VIGEHDELLTSEEIFRRKAEQRKASAKAPIEEKLQDLMRLQRIAYVMAKAAKRKPPIPWHMNESDS
jgi:hypothetical protein